MKRYDWTEGQGLGKNVEGMMGILAGGAQSSGFGLGFEAPAEDYQGLTDSEMDGLMGRKKPSTEEAEADIRKASEFTVCATSEEVTRPYPWIRELAPGEELDNWEAYGFKRKEKGETCVKRKAKGISFGALEEEVEGDQWFEKKRRRCG
ncbi:hypothetical protein COLO4_08115 [Corchorus olitorius]|uniref:G-patch domain-containing protein n=1 Tax=Corchorus olitorius TaxID=93759 RepID=A0A1R3KHC7_9ROSI|nr:hypothetical protein COLO4_08115 [Corchorus olitorius]